MVSPSGLKVYIGGESESYIIDREKFDAEIVQDAIEAGAVYQNNFAVQTLSRCGDGTYDCKSSDRTVNGRCIILAEGVESRLARQCGWDTALTMSDIETCAFARVISPFIEKEVCFFYTGSQFSPGGYAWVFPRGAGEANAGLGICGSNSDPGKAKVLLETFIDKEFPASKVSHLHCGAVPVARWLRPLVRENVMIVGDAARQVNCLSGGGIGYSLYAGKTAGTFAGQAISGSSVDYSILRKYEKEWKKNFGKQQDRSYSLKKFLLKYGNDQFLNRIANSLLKENPDKMNYLRVFTRTFAKNPWLLFKTVQVFK
jgi:digeranylgeranylglycerophospholipid reductase